MPKYLIAGLVGLIIGAVATFFIFVGVPRASKTPGAPIQGPDPNSPAGSAQVVLRQDFFNDILTSMFRDMRPPTFPLGMAATEPQSGGVEYAAFMQGGCESVITILPEGSGVKTGVRFENNKIQAPLAFTGKYSSPFGCLDFTGWAQTALELRFDKDQQSLFGRINVETVNLDGVNPALSGFVTPLVQSSLNNKVNPIQILNGKQIGIAVPLASTGGTLNAQVNDMRAEFKDNALNLYVVYTFNGAQVQ